MKRLPTQLKQATIILLLGTAISLTVGCGGDSESETEGVLSGYHLDPPELAPGGFDRAEAGVPVFCYHYFRSGFDAGYLMKVLGSVLFGMPALGPREFWTTPEGEFEKHLRYFRDSRTEVLTLDEVADLVEAGQELPRRAVVLTIDDADRSVYELAYPLLKKYGMRAHLFVPTAKVGTSWSELDVCSWEELNEMAASGHIIVESHTRDLHFKVRTTEGLEPVFFHPDQVPDPVRLRNLNHLAQAARAQTDHEFSGHMENLLAGPYATVAADLVSSRMDIMKETGHESRWLAWPYGFATAALDSISREAGFRGTVSLYPEAFSDQDSTLQVGRYTLTAKSTLGHIANVFPE